MGDEFPKVGGAAPAGQPLRPAFSADEAQPAAATNEHNALSEREDGTNRGGPDPDGAPVRLEAMPTTVLAADEPQPASAVSEHNALSEREDGANRG